MHHSFLRRASQLLVWRTPKWPGSNSPVFLSLRSSVLAIAAQAGNGVTGALRYIPPKSLKSIREYFLKAQPQQYAASDVAAPWNTPVGVRRTFFPNGKQSNSTDVSKIEKGD